MEPTHDRKGIKVMQDTSYPTATTNVRVTNRLLAANSPEYSVPLTAAVTYIIIKEVVGSHRVQWTVDDRNLKRQLLCHHDLLRTECIYGQIKLHMCEPQTVMCT